jgi:hypothetical protein
VEGNGNDRHADRYSPMTVSALLRLPECSARSFMVASALGRFVRQDGSFEALRSAKDAAGSVIGKTQRVRILKVLNIQPRRWRALVDDWELRYIAHRCRRGEVCLFVRPLEAKCPACSQEIEVTEVSPRPDARRHRRGRPKQSGTGTTTEAALVQPKSGSNSAARVSPTVPLSVADSAHPNGGSLQGHEVGVPTEAGEEMTAEEAQRLLNGFTKRAAAE